MGYTYENRATVLGAQERYASAKQTMKRLAADLDNYTFSRNPKTNELEKVNSRANVAERIVMTFLHVVETKLIRPGPKPEERECYEMAQELRGMSPEFEAIVMAIFEQTDGVK